MVATFELVLLAVVAGFFAVLTAGLVGLYVAIERKAQFEPPSRRRVARAAFGLGAVSFFLASTSLGASFVLDIEAAFGLDSLFVGIGAVFGSALPLGLGLTLLFAAADGP
jgi:hypothetical protein